MRQDGGLPEYCLQIVSVVVYVFVEGEAKLGVGRAALHDPVLCKRASFPVELAMR